MRLRFGPAFQRVHAVVKFRFFSEPYFLNKDGYGNNYDGVNDMWL